MTQYAALDHSDFASRWRNWQAKGVEADRRRTAIMRRVSAVLVAALIISLWGLLR
jgi:hypothetical protein